MFQIKLSVEMLIYSTLAASNDSDHDSSIVGDQNEGVLPPINDSKNPGDEQPQRVSSYFRLPSFFRLSSIEGCLPSKVIFH